MTTVVQTKTEKKKLDTLNNAREKEKKKNRK